MHTYTLRPEKNIQREVTKFGGQPNWVAEPAWPLSREFSTPMRFIAQFRLPSELTDSQQRMAYVFMTDDEEYVDGTWEAEGGENAVILQPGPFTPIVDTRNSATGPTLQKGIDGAKRRTYEDTELAVVESEAPDDSNQMSRIGGEPRWLQGDERPTDGIWRFISQIDSAKDEYSVNFGDAGVGYVFCSADGTKARFLWQCC